MRISRKLPLSLALVTCVMAFAAGPAAGKPSEHPLEIIPGSFHITPSTDQAAAHSNWVTSFDFAHNSEQQTSNDVRETVVNLPAGFDASNTAVPTCTIAQLLGAVQGTAKGRLPACPSASTVGTISLYFAGTEGNGIRTYPIYNMEVTSFGVTAQLGFKILDGITQILTVRVRPGDFGLTVTAPDIEQIAEVHDISVTVWGVPASHEHDLERQQICEANAGGPGCINEFGGPLPVHVVVNPFLSNPTSCGPFTATMEAVSWEEPNNVSKATTEVGPIGECERVPFDPSIEVQPSTRSAESPTGLDVSLVVPQAWDNPFTVSTANLKDAKVTLPEGMTANPSLAAGLGACTPAQYELETSSSLPGEGCPAESKIGSIVIETPLLAEKIPGAIYIAKPYDNVPAFGDPQHPNGSLLALYVVAKDPERGIIVKVAGKIEPNPVTGQLVTTFLNNPQQPFSRFTLKFRPGATAPLVSPPACGSYTTQAELTPWSAPLEPLLVSSTPFQTTQGVHEGPCPSGGVPPFHPQVLSGTQNNAGGAYSPFYLRIIRDDGEQEMTGFSTVLPPGLSGNLTGIPFCSDAAIEASKHVSGTQELNAPSCPAASEIGHTIVSAGVGPVLAQTPGKVYLAGPYHGSALSIVSITSATVGPFDLGTVVIRFALRINPSTAQVEVDATGSDPIPHIIQGIVVHVRDIHVYVDRPKFILDPTSCNAMSITNTITGAGADFTNAADANPVTVTTPFQAADCSSLKFAPKFSANTAGAAHPNGPGASFHVRVLAKEGPGGGEANIKRVEVQLPKLLPARLTTLQKSCTQAQFSANPAGCPEFSFVGTATAHTPVLANALTGPAILVSHGGAAFPDLVIVLQGEGITLDLVGNTQIKNGITYSRFETVPDAPVSSFALDLPQSKHSALSSTSFSGLCGQNLVMPTFMEAQNGAQLHQNTNITITGCGPKISITKKKLQGNSVSVTVKTSVKGVVTITGAGLRKTTKTLGPGSHTLKVPLTATGRTARNKHHKIKIKAALKAGKKTVSKSTGLKL